MKTHSRPRLIVALLSIATVATVALAITPAGLLAAGDEPSTGPEWFDHYRRAGVHAELEDWTAVASDIRRAISLNPRPQRNVRIYGMWHASYMPYFYLGLAQYRLGQYKEAMESFREEERAGVIRHDPVAWLKMKKLMASASSPSPSPPPSSQGATAVISTPPAARGSGETDPVISGLEAFFKSDYDASIAAFQEAMKTGRDDDLTLHLYLGMAYAGKASSDQGNGKLWENLAFLEFQRVHALDPGYRLSSGIFSEEMMNLFESSGAGTGTRK